MPVYGLFNFPPNKVGGKYRGKGLVNMHRKEIKKVENNKIQEDILKGQKEYLNNIAHDLATPITIISGYAQMLKEKALSQDELYIRAIDNIEITSRRLQIIIDEYIELAK